MRFSVLGFRSEKRIELQAPVVYEGLKPKQFSITVVVKESCNFVSINH